MPGLRSYGSGGRLVTPRAARACGSGYPRATAGLEWLAVSARRRYTILTD
jgi:hypothetical protein